MSSYRGQDVFVKPACLGRQSNGGSSSYDFSPYLPFRSKRLIRWLNVDLLPVLESIAEQDREALRRFLGLKLSGGIGRRSTARIGLLLFEALKDGEATVNISALARRAGIGRTAATRAVDYFRNPAEGIAKLEQIQVRRTGERRPGVYRIRPDLLDCGKQQEKAVTSASVHPSYTGPQQELENPRLSIDKTTAGGRVHLWQPTQAWIIAVRGKARSIFADVTRKPLQAILADAAVCHLKREVIAGRLRPRLFDSAVAEIAGQLRGSDPLEELEATTPARRDVYRVVGWAVRLWREERLRQAEAWRQSARAHWEFQAAKRETEADPLDFDVVAMVRRQVKRNVTTGTRLSSFAERTSAASWAMDGGPSETDGTRRTVTIAGGQR